MFTDAVVPANVPRAVRPVSKRVRRALSLRSRALLMAAITAAAWAVVPAVRAQSVSAGSAGTEASAVSTSQPAASRTAVPSPASVKGLRPGQIEVVAELPIRPGNVAAAPGGRVFATVHPLGGDAPAQLVEITGKSGYVPWPSAALQRGTAAATDDQIDTPLGIHIDGRNRLWIVDMGLNRGETRLWAFNVSSGALMHRIILPQSVAPKGSFVQDLVVDDKADWVYLADIANPGLIAVEVPTGIAHRFSGHPSLQAEPAARMVIGGKAIQFQGQPANVAVNPITLSADGESLFFGAMNGKTWYRVPTELLRRRVPETRIADAIERVGPKPVSDGAATDREGRHYFTNLNEGGLDRLDRNGRLVPLVRDPRMDWPDSVHVSDTPWLYVSVNQLHKTPAFTGGADEGKPPYRILRVWSGPPQR